MFDFKSGLHILKPRSFSLSKRSSPSPGIAYFIGADRDNYFAVVTKGDADGVRSFDYNVKVGYLSADRFFCQLRTNPDNSIVGTAVVTTGAANLPAQVAATAVIKDLITLRLVGTIGSTQALTPNAYIDFSGGRG